MPSYNPLERFGLSFCAKEKSAVDASEVELPMLDIRTCTYNLIYKILCAEYLSPVLRQTRSFAQDTTEKRVSGGNERNGVVPFRLHVVSPTRHLAYSYESPTPISASQIPISAHASRELPCAMMFETMDETMGTR